MYNQLLHMLPLGCPVVVGDTSRLRDVVLLCIQFFFRILVLLYCYADILFFNLDTTAGGRSFSKEKKNRKVRYTFILTRDELYQFAVIPSHTDYGHPMKVQIKEI
mgnify:CR=1 FL=1